MTILIAPINYFPTSLNLMNNNSITRKLIQLKFTLRWHNNSAFYIHLTAVQCLVVNTKSLWLSIPSLPNKLRKKTSSRVWIVGKFNRRTKSMALIKQNSPIEYSSSVWRYLKLFNSLQWRFLLMLLVTNNYFCI